MRKAQTLLSGAVIIGFLAGCGTNSEPTRTATAAAPAATGAATQTAAFGPPQAAPVAPEVRRAAKRPCTKFAVETKPFEIGTGLKDLIRQARGYRTARTKLAERLEAMPAKAADRSMILRYSSRLRANSAYLAETERRAKTGDVQRTFAVYGKYHQAIRVEARIARQLKLAVCG